MTGLLKEIYQMQRQVIILSSLLMSLISQKTMAEQVSCTFVFRTVHQFSSENAETIKKIQAMMNNQSSNVNLFNEKMNQLNTSMTLQQSILNSEIKYLDRLLSLYFHQWNNTEFSQQERELAEANYHAAFRLQNLNFRELIKVENQMKSNRFVGSTLMVKDQVTKQHVVQIDSRLKEITKTQVEQERIKLFSDYLKNNSQLNLANFHFIIQHILPIIDLNSNQANLILINAVNKKFQVEWKNWENIGELGLAYYLIFKVNSLDLGLLKEYSDLQAIYQDILKSLNQLTLKAEASVVLDRKGNLERQNTLFKAQLKTVIAEDLEIKITNLAKKVGT